MRKLKRKSSNIIDNEIHNPAIVKRKLRKRYKKQKCAFVEIDGPTSKKCKRNAAGKSTLCKRHGGDPIVVENLISVLTEGVTDKMALVTSKFRPDFHPLSYIDFSRQGLSEVEIAAQFEVGLTTMRGWSEKYLEFSTAFEIGNALYEAWWLEKGRTNLNDRTFNTNLFKFLTGNKLGYSDKMETKNLNTNIHGVLLVPSKMTENEWAADNVEPVEPVEPIEEAEIV